MKHFIFLLQFHGPFRFTPLKGIKSLDGTGLMLPSDALFSAVLIEGMALYGKPFAQELVQEAESDRFLLSNLMPCRKIPAAEKGRHQEEIELFIPKPQLSIPRGHLSGDKEDLALDEKALADRKKLKKLPFIPISQLQNFVEYMKAPSPEKLEAIWKLSPHLETYTEWKNQIPLDAQLQAETLPYPVTVNRGGDTTYYYFVAAMEEDFADKMQTIMLSLQHTGLGGKKSVGYGKFNLVEKPFELDLEDTTANDYVSWNCLAEALSLQNPEYVMTLSSLLPEMEELEKVQDKSYYAVSTRTGFVSSVEYASHPLKKKTVVMMDAGSCFPWKISARIVDVKGAEGAHSVYRMGKALWMGVNIHG